MTSNIKRNKDNDFKVLEKASEKIIEKLKIDETYQDLYDQTRQDDKDKGGHAYFVDQSWGPTIEQEQFIPLPVAFRNINFEHNYSTGLFPEIGRVWILADNILYLWDYNNQNEDDSQFEPYEIYDGLSEVVISVALSTPRPGIFVDSVKYILVIATPIEVVILALAFDEYMQNLKLIPTSYVIPSDDVAMIKVIGCQNGRIFMGGDNGNVYELAYDNVDNSWASLLGVGPSSFKCQKIDHTSWKWKMVHLLPPPMKTLIGGNDPLTELAVDNVRNVLYALSSNGYLSVFHLGIDGQTTSLIVNRCNIFEKSKKFLMDVRNRSNFPPADCFEDIPKMKFIGAFIIPVTESKKLHMVLLLNTGVRIYLSLVSPSIVMSNTPGAFAWTNLHEVPVSIEVIHVRSPPSPRAIACCKTGQLDVGMEAGITPEYLPSNRLDIRKGLYSQGTLLYSLEQSPLGLNTLVVIHEDSLIRDPSIFTPQQPNLREHVCIPNLHDSSSNTLPDNIIDLKEFSNHIHDPKVLMMQTMYTVSSTPSTSITSREEDPYPMQTITCTDSMTQTLAIPFPGTALAPQGARTGLSWGLAPNSTEYAILRHDNANQHIPLPHTSDTHRKFVCLSNTGVHIIKKLFPADFLINVITQNITSSSSQDYLKRIIKPFFQQFGIIEASTMCLGLSACLPTVLPSPDLMKKSIEIMFAAIYPAGPEVIKPVLNQLHRDTRVAVVSDLSKPEIKFSPVHDALYTLTSRILRPLWLRSIVRNGSPSAYICYEFLQSSIIEPLQAVARILEEYFPLAIREDPASQLVNLEMRGKTFLGGAIIDPFSTTGLMAMNALKRITPEQADAQYARSFEECSLNSLYIFIQRCMQAINLISHLLDARTRFNCHADWKTIEKINFRAFVILPTVHIKIKKILQKILQILPPNDADEFSVDIFRDCFFYFSTGDRRLYNANKSLESIPGHLINLGGSRPEVMNDIVNKCVTLYLRAAKYWKTQDYVSNDLVKVCSTLKYLGREGRLGIVDLCFTVAKNFEMDDRARSNAFEFENIVDRKDIVEQGLTPLQLEIFHGATAMSQSKLDDIRRECYKCLLSIMSYIRNIPPVHGAKADTDAPPLTAVRDIEDLASAYAALQQMIKRSLQATTDPIFFDLLCTHVFSWPNSNFRQLILEIKADFVEDYLILKNPDLLWSFYRQHGEFIKAAEKIFEIATTRSKLTIVKRVEFLNAAVADANEAAKYRNAFLDEWLENTASEYQNILDVAEFQLLAFQSDLSALEKNDKDRLENVLLVFGELYEICEKAHLWNLNLRIIKEANIENGGSLDLVIAKFWRSIIYRVVPDTATTPAAKVLLVDKRRPDYIFKDLKNQCKQPMYFEDSRVWGDKLSDTVSKLGKELYSFTRDDVFPLAVIIEELEEIASISPVFIGRGWAVDCLQRIPVPYDVLVPAYVEVIFDRWAGKQAEKLLQVISSAAYLLKNWTNIAIQMNTSTSVAEHRHLMQSIQSGRFHIWHKRLRKYMNTLTSKSLSKTFEQLYKDVLLEINEIEQTLTQLTLM